MSTIRTVLLTALVAPIPFTELRAQTERDDPPPFVAKARTWLAREQGADGRWPAAATPPHRRLEAEALAALALTTGSTQEQSAARRAVVALARVPRRPHQEYGRVLWILAALASDAQRSDTADGRSVDALLRSELRAIPELETFESRSTQFTALTLLALHAAQRAGLENTAGKSSERVAALRANLLARCAGEDGMFHEHSFPSRSLAATALAAEALARTQTEPSEELSRSIRWLERQSTRGILDEVTRARHPHFYVRGRRLFELRAQLSALRAARSTASARIRKKLAEAANARLGDAPTIEGYFGRVYGTALLILCFEGEAK